MIYLNEYQPIKYLAKKNIFYFQNIDYAKPEETIANFLKKGYIFDAYISFSNKAKQLFDCYTKKTSLYLPFAADTEMFYPRKIEDRYRFDCAYIGNDIKGEEATLKYIYPAINFNFGLFGNWKIQRHRFMIWKNFKKVPEYKKVFERISRGKILQEELPILYSSAKIILNYTSPNAYQWDIITLRTYEVLACKGFLISDITSYAEKELEDCIVFTVGGDDLIKKIKYYIDNEDERKEISEKGYQYVQNSGKMELRAKDLVQFIENIIL